MKAFTCDKGYYIMIKISIHEEDITIIYAHLTWVPKYEANAKYEANVNRYKETDSSTIVVGATLTCCIIG